MAPCLAGEADGVDHAFDASLAEAAGNEDAVVPSSACSDAAGPFEILRLNPADLHFYVVRETAVEQRFLEALVRIFVLDVFADDPDLDLAFRMLQRGAPCRAHFERSRGPASMSEDAQNEVVHTLVGENERDFVDRLHVAGR